MKVTESKTFPNEYYHIYNNKGEMVAGLWEGTAGKQDLHIILVGNSTLLVSPEKKKDVEIKTTKRNTV